MDRRLILAFAVVAVSIGGAVAWRVLRVEKPVVEPVARYESRSLVVLFGEPFAKDKGSITKELEAEFGKDVKVVGDLPALFVQVERHTLVLQVFGKAYPMGAFANLRIEHSGWLKVEHNARTDSGSMETYALMGRVVAALLEESAVAVLHPQTSEWAHVTASTRENLREPDVLEALFRVEKLPPPDPMDYTAPTFVAAREQARRRWPEFVKAYRARKGADFRVKAAFTRGDVTEHIWFLAVEVDEKRAAGWLTTEPIELPGLTRGSPVAAAVSEIDDWSFTFKGKTVGRFTTAAVEGRK